MKIETVAISSLTPDPRNARLHEQGVPELAASLETFGQRKNLVVWHDVVISGNGLMLAAQSLDWEEIAIDRVPDDWPYEKAQAYALADNKTAELSAWDPIRAGEIVLDPFGGSGSTLIACEMTGRQCRMIEVDPIYVDVVVKRWEDFTGLKATRTR